MLNSNERLTILTLITASYTDISSDMQDFTRDTQTFNLDADVLHVGYYKPINKIYIDLTTPNSVTNTLQIQFWNGTTWADVDGLIDETKGCTRSGFIQWARESTDQVAHSVNSISKYWYRVVASVQHADSVYNGIGLMFADDKDLSEQVPEINDDAHLAGRPSHILAHVAAKKLIIQDLRNANYGKRDSDGVLQDITVWDLLEIDQINTAAIFKALSIIYFNYSDEPNDIYEKKSKSYASQFKSAMQLAKLSLDLDDDGVKDVNENSLEFKNKRVTR